MNGKLVVGLTGMPGAGKSVVVRAAEELGYDVIVMGDEVREEARKRSLKPTPENLGKIMLELRRTEGETVIARRCIQKVKASAKEKIIIDGVRSLREVEEFKRHFSKFSLIAVFASPETRFKRLYKRGRSDDPKNWRIFHGRDLRELSVGLGEVIALADHTIVNEDRVENAKRSARKILKKVESKWMK